MCLSSSRLSDRIFAALDLAIQQEDIAAADLLVQALDHSMTRNAGGGEFIERRNYSPEIIAVIERLAVLKQGGESDEAALVQASS